MQHSTFVIVFTTFCLNNQYYFTLLVSLLLLAIVQATQVSFVAHLPYKVFHTFQYT